MEFFRTYKELKEKVEGILPYHMRNTKTSGRKTVYQRDSLARASEAEFYDTQEIIRFSSYAKTRQKERQEKANRKRTVRAWLFAFGIAALLLPALATLISYSSETAALMKEISQLETEYENIRSINDSKEYDLTSHASMKEIVEQAEAYGMQRANAGQIIYYSKNNSEYIQKVGEIPQN